MPYVDRVEKRKGDRRVYAKVKYACFQKLGGKCKTCGISDLEVLQLDHIIPVKVTKEKRLLNAKAYRVILKGNIEDFTNYQLLCANCHMKKTVKEMMLKTK